MALTSTFVTLAVLLFLLFRGREARIAIHGMPPRARAGTATVVNDFGYWCLGAFIPLFRSLHLTPNALSLISLPASLGASIAIATGHFGAGGPLLLFAFALDAWDGLLARELGTASDAGEVVDAMIDRYNDVIIMLGFLFYYRADPVPWLLASAALVGSVAVSYARAKGESFGVATDAGGMQRQQRALWLGGATVIAPAIASMMPEPVGHPRYYAVVLALAVVAVGTNLTALRRARLVIAHLASRRRLPT